MTNSQPKTNPNPKRTEQQLRDIVAAKGDTLVTPKDEPQLVQTIRMIVRQELRRLGIDED